MEEREVAAQLLALEAEIVRRDQIIDEAVSAMRSWLAWVGSVRFEHGSEIQRQRRLLAAQDATRAVLEDISTLREETRCHDPAASVSASEGSPPEASTSSPSAEESPSATDSDSGSDSSLPT